MRLQNLYNSESWGTLCDLYRAVAVVRRDGTLELSGGELGDALASALEQKRSPLLHRMQNAFQGERVEFLSDIDESNLPELLKANPLLDESDKVVAILVTADDAPKDVLRLSEVQTQLSEYEFVVQSIRQGIWRLDDKGVVIACNPYLAHWLEYEESEMIGQQADRFMVSSESVQADSQEPSTNAEAEFVTKSGIRRHGLMATCPTLSPNGSVSGMMGIVTDITAEHALHSKLVNEVQKMAKLASLDPLTGAANRLAFDIALENLEATADQSPFGIVALDLNFFKQVNDTFGHVAGDHVLIQVVSRLKRFVRNTDVVARVGGDEFVVLLADASPELTEQIADRLVERLQFFFKYEGNRIPVQVSIGWAHSSQGVAGIMQRADTMLYERKRTPRSGQTIADLARWIDAQPEIL